MVELLKFKVPKILVKQLLVDRFSSTSCEPVFPPWKYQIKLKGMATKKNNTRTNSCGTMMMEFLTNKKPEILQIAKKYGASNIKVFGSFAKGEITPDSDIDFLMDIEKGHSLFHRIQLMQELEDLLGRKVDIAKPENLHECIREQVLREAIKL